MAAIVSPINVRDCYWDVHVIAKACIMNHSYMGVLGDCSLYLSSQTLLLHYWVFSAYGVGACSRGDNHETFTDRKKNVILYVCSY